MGKAQQHLNTKLSSKKYYSTLFPSSAVWNLIPGHLEQIDGVNARSNLFDRLGRRPRKVCVWVGLVGWGLMAEEPGVGKSWEAKNPN